MRLGLTYEIHTGRELELMLSGRKPFAVMSDLILEGCENTEIAEPFEPYVRSGQLIKHEDIERWDDHPKSDRQKILGRVTRLYAVPGEEWRIPAYLLLRRVSDKGRWNDALERQLGSLLGYTDDQNEEWLRVQKRRHAGWQCFTFHAAISHEVLQEILLLGRKAFPVSFLKDAIIFYSERRGNKRLLRTLGVEEDKAHLVRFGVSKRFSESYLVKADSGRVTRFNLRSRCSIKALNEGLVTEIEKVA